MTTTLRHAVATPSWLVETAALKTLILSRLDMATQSGKFVAVRAG